MKNCFTVVQEVIIHLPIRSNLAFMYDLQVFIKTEFSIKILTFFTYSDFQDILPEIKNNISPTCLVVLCFNSSVYVSLI